MAESDSPAWRNATVKAAKIVKQEGLPVMVAFAPDRDGDPKTADTIVWANGVKRDIEPYEVKEGYTVDMTVSVDPKRFEERIHKTGYAIYSKYLYVPPR